LYYHVLRLFEWRIYTVGELNVTGSVKASIEGEVAYNLDQVIRIYKQTFAPVTIMVGPVPIVITPTLNVYAGFTGKVSAEVSLGVSISTFMKAGFVYSEGELKPVGEFTPSYSFDYPTLNNILEPISFDLIPYVENAVGIGLYGVNIVEVPAPRLYLDFEYTPFDTYVWKLYGGLKSEFRISEDIKVLKIPFEPKVIFDRKLLFIGNQMPNTPSDPNPPNGSTIESLSPTLSWSCSDPDNDELKYNIYFGTNDNPPLIIKDSITNTFKPGELSENTTYYWKIVAKDGKFRKTEGPIWSFTTGSKLSSARGIYVLGNYAYVSSDFGLDIVDITDLTNPTLIGHWDVDNAEDRGLEVCISGNYAYIADEYNGLGIVDITDPTNPIGHLYTGVVPSGVFVSGNYAYVADNVYGLVIVDITDPTNPNKVGRLDTSWVDSVCVSGNYAYVNDSLDGLIIVDITDLNNPILVEQVDLGWSGDGNRGLYVSGDYAYIADNDNGLVIIDITDPTHPSQIGHLDTGGYAQNVYVSGNYAFVADFSNGLVIVDVTDPSNPELVGSM